MIDKFQNREAVSFIVTGVIVATIGAIGVESAGLSASTAFLVGLAASIPIEFFRDWLLDWLEARRVTSPVSASGGDSVKNDV